MTSKTDINPRPIAWWFTRGAASLITIPVFLLLFAGMVGAFFQGGIQTLAYIKVTKAGWGWLGVSAFCLFILPFSLLLPGWLWWAAIKEAPSIHRKEAVTKSSGAGVRLALFTVVLLVAFSMFIQWGHGQIIGWIADRYPDKVYDSGVTGSKPVYLLHNDK